MVGHRAQRVKGRGLFEIGEAEGLRPLESAPENSRLRGESPLYPSPEELWDVKAMLDRVGVPSQLF